MAVLNLTKAYGTDRLEAACAYALEKAAVVRCRFLKSVLANGVESRRETIIPTCEDGGYVRGSSYYSGKGDER